MTWYSLLLRTRKKRHIKSSKSFSSGYLALTSPHTSFPLKRRRRKPRLYCQYGSGRVATTRTRRVHQFAISRLIIKFSSKTERLYYFKGVLGFSSMRTWWSLP